MQYKKLYTNFTRMMNYSLIMIEIKKIQSGRKRFNLKGFGEILKQQETEKNRVLYSHYLHHFFKKTHKLAHYRT